MGNDERGAASRHFANVSSDSPAVYLRRATAANQDEESANLNHRHWRPIVDNVTHSGTSEERRRNRLPFAEDSRTSNASDKDCWPALPPAPSFELADELQAKETETEALRRLEQEQRGILWNA
jgi:hypothetical protein